MENAKRISTAEPEKITLDGVEIAGLVVPLLFAIMTIVLVAIAPDSAGTLSRDSTTASQRAELTEQIRKRWGLFSGESHALSVHKANAQCRHYGKSINLQCG
mgnify:CR=1 FL=1